MAYMYKRGDIWYVAFNIDGRVRRVSTGLKKKSAAEEIFFIYLKREKENDHGIPAPIVPMTVSEYYPIYKEIYETELSPGWAKIKDILFKAHILKSFGKMRLDRIDPLSIDRYRAKRRSLGIKSNTINKEIGCLMSMLRHAGEKKIIPYEKIPHVKKLKDKKGRVRYLSLDEVRTFMATLKEAHPDVITYCMLMLYGGLRKGEAMHLRWADVDFEQRKLHIWPREEWSPKSYGRSVPISDDLHSYLFDRRIQLYECPMVVGASTEWTLERSIRRIVKKSGLPWEGEEKVTAHTLRHTFASHLVMNGTPLYTVGAMLGHRDSKTTEIYAHLSPEHLSLAAKGIRYDI